MNRVLTQTGALFLDAYRELNSKKLFWISLAISVLVVVGFAAIGVNAKGVTLLWWSIGDFGGFVNSDTMPPAVLYKKVFAAFGIKFWLAWLATILALVSTAGMIPDFIAGGAVELSLSKPIGRVRLLLTKFCTGMLFVALQVAVFSAACFLVIGLRGGTWEPAVFLAVPVVVAFYSYLFSICVLLGLLTRSTIASLLITLLIWFGLFAVNASDAFIIQGREMARMRAERFENRITQLEKQKEGKGDAEIKNLESRIAGVRKDLDETRAGENKWNFAAGMVHGGKTVLPKTGETTDLLERALNAEMHLKDTSDEGEADPDSVRFGQRLSPRDQVELTHRIERALRGRSVAWVLGTSLGFEGVVLAIACWVFARRDF